MPWGDQEYKLKLQLIDMPQKLPFVDQEYSHKLQLKVFWEDQESKHKSKPQESEDYITHTYDCSLFVISKFIQ